MRTHLALHLHSSFRNIQIGPFYNDLRQSIAIVDDTAHRSRQSETIAQGGVEANVGTIGGLSFWSRCEYRVQLFPRTNLDDHDK